MFRFVLFCLMCSAFASKTFAQQNLVPNPSFEDYTDCPEGYPDLDGKLNDWMSFRETPDYLHNCSFLNGYRNNWGFQEPHSGEAYISLIPYSVSGAMPPLTREHLGVQLVSPLTIGTKYFVSFYASAAWEPKGMTIATNKTGVLFTTYTYSDPTSMQPLKNHCHVWADDVISDTVNWVKISGSFIADSAYSHLVVGNFFEDAFTDTLNLPTSIGINQRAMVYIDDICVSTDSSECTFISLSENIASDQFIVYPNPVSERLYVNHTYQIEPNVVLHEITGRLVPVLVKYQKKLIEIDVSHLQSGLYYLRIESQGFTTTKEVFVNH